MPRPPSHCAICGTEISPNARACPECGADERTGWREQDPYDGLDLPEAENTADAYARFLRENDIQVGRANAKRLLWTAIIVGVGILFTIVTVFWRLASL